MNREKILVTYPLPMEGLQDLKQKFEVIRYKEYSIPRSNLLYSILDCAGVLAAMVNVDEELMDAAPKLKIISVYGSGYDNVDVKAATERGILVTNIPDAVTDSTAELTIGLMLNVMRRISEFDRKLRQKDSFSWGRANIFGHVLHDKELGIVGMGRIGRAVAKRASAFGMRISYYNRKRLDPVIEMELGVAYKRFDDLLKAADVISIHTPLNKETRHLIGERELSMMKSSAYLINTSRGAVIDEKALVRHLMEGKLAGAGLDVYEEEPIILPELLKLDNVVLTPHIGTDTFETHLQMTRESAQNIIDFFNGRHPFHAVNPQVFRE
ncbi:MAG: NAD(P)-dependent oxidoreductase [Clostridia bacterium]|jgi:glyoxylate reductase|nr:NAD(P)-dependent oxidoreductase [Clostridia bacterium]